MLNPLYSLSQYAAQRGLGLRAQLGKESALLKVLLHPTAPTGSADPEVLRIAAVYAHGRTATRVIRTSGGYVAQDWHLGADTWWPMKGFSYGGGEDASALHEACALAKAASGDPISRADFVGHWKFLDDVVEGAEPFESRLKLAEFFYEQQGVDWGERGANPWAHLADVATVALMHDGEVPEGWDPKTRERVRETLRNLQLAWGEIKPVEKTVVDASPRYLVSVTNVSVPSAKLRPGETNARTFGTLIDHQWMTGDEMAAAAKQYNINHASCSSPSGAEHVWWASPFYTAKGILEERYQLDVHDVTDTEEGIREPMAEDFQRIGNVIGVAFEEPIPVRAVVIQHDEFGVYLGNCMGMGFWSKLDPVGQTCAVTFANAAEAKAHMEGWDGGIPKGAITYPEVEADVDSGRYASLSACVRAGLSEWDPKEPQATARAREEEHGVAL